MARKLPHGRPTSLTSQTEERSGDPSCAGCPQFWVDWLLIEYFHNTRKYYATLRNVIPT